jgi:hypothetical protein
LQLLLVSFLEEQNFISLNHKASKFDSSSTGIERFSQLLEAFKWLSEFPSLLPMGILFETLKKNLLLYSALYSDLFYHTNGHFDRHN